MGKKSEALSAKRRSKAQASLEYFTILGFIIFMTIPLLIIYFDSINDAGDEINARQVLQIARKIADASESVYFLGEPSQTTLKVFIPQNIKNATIINKEVVFTIKTKAGISEIVQTSSVNMTGALPISQGIHTIKIKAETNSASISYS